MSSSSIITLKRKAIEELLKLEDFFLVVIDTRVAGVVLPTSLLEAQNPVGIHIGLKMAIPIPDLTIDETGISGTLSFFDTSQRCRFPWESIAQISVGDEHVVWLGSSVADGDSQTSDRPKLRVVK